MSFKHITREKLQELFARVGIHLDAQGSPLDSRQRLELLHRFYAGAHELQVAHFNWHQAFSPDNLVDVSSEEGRPDLMVCRHFGLVPLSAEYAKTRGYLARDTDTPDMIVALNLFWNVAVGNITGASQGVPAGEPVVTV